MNPELLRNIWLEWTPVKRIAAPIAIIMIAIIANALPHQEPGVNWQAIQGLGLAVFGLFAIWGAARASDGITSEIAAGTWDWQRLAPHRPIDLLVGKLFGTPIFEWYGAAFGLVMFVVGQAAVRPPLYVLQNAVILVVYTLLLHAIALLFSFSIAGKFRGVRRPGRLGGRQGAIAAIILFVLNVGPVAGFLWAGAERSTEPPTIIPWWLPLPARDFVLLTGILFLAWAVIGLYRMIRAELQEPVTPWPWLAFLVFTVAYLYPLAQKFLVDGLGSQPAALAAMGVIVFGGWVWPMLVAERKDIVWLRSITAAYQRGDTANVLTLTPLWTVTYAGYMACVCLLGASLVGGTPPADARQLALLALVFGIFMLRDVGIVMGIHLSIGPRRPDLVVIFMGVMLYGLLPGMLALLGDYGIMLLHLFLPVAAFANEGAVHTERSLLIAVAAALPGLAIAWVFAYPKLSRALVGMQPGAGPVKEQP